MVGFNGDESHGTKSPKKQIQAYSLDESFHQPYEAYMTSTQHLDARCVFATWLPSQKGSFLVFQSHHFSGVNLLLNFGGWYNYSIPKSLDMERYYDQGGFQGKIISIHKSKTHRLYHELDHDTVR